MKKIFFLVLAICLLLSATAVAEEWAVTYDLGGFMDRVKLREKPNTDGKVLGQYFANVYVEILSTSGEFSKVRIGGREGYMMSRYLKPVSESEMDYRFEGMLGFVRFPDADEGLPFYETASTKATVRKYLPKEHIHVLATMENDWLHVAYTDGDTPVYGYASSLGITQADNMSTCYGDTGEAAKKISLRSTPSTSAKSVAQFYNGTDFYILFDDSPNSDKFTKVRIDDMSGFILTDSLNFSGGEPLSFLPPLAAAKKDKLPTYTTYNGKTAEGTLDKTHVFAVLGLRGERYYISVETDTPWTYTYCYVNKTDVTPVTTSAKNTATLKKAFTLDDGSTVQKGTKVHIFGEDSSYLQPDCEFVKCEILYEAPGKTHSHSLPQLIPTADLNIDPLLFYPKD